MLIRGMARIIRRRGFRRRRFSMLFRAAILATVIATAVSAGFLIWTAIPGGTVGIGGFPHNLLAAFLFRYNPDNSISAAETSEMPGFTGASGLPKMASETIPASDNIGYYSSAGADIEEVTPYTGEIEEGMFAIIEKNFSGQKSSVAQLLINNQTSFSIEPESFSVAEYPIKGYEQGNAEPLVLIISTHATEGYCDTETFMYAPAFTAPRSEDPGHNVVGVAARLCEVLNNNGIPAIQDTTIHDMPSYNASYSRSLETAKSYLEKYPSIKYVIDVHRDSIIDANGIKYNPVISVDGKKAAQVMLVVGTSDGGASHPDWRDNLTFAVHWQNTLNSVYPMLARPINLRASRFNQHIAAGAVIVEIGSCGTTYAQALYSAELAGKCLADLIKQNSAG